MKTRRDINTTIHFVGPSEVGKTTFFGSLLNEPGGGKRKLLEASSRGNQATEDVIHRHSPASTALEDDETALIADGKTVVRLVSHSGEMCNRNAEGQEAEKRLLADIRTGDVVAVVVNPFALDREIASFALRFFVAYFQVKNRDLKMIDAVHLACAHLFHWTNGYPDKRNDEQEGKPRSDNFPEFDQLRDEYAHYALVVDESILAGPSPFKLCDRATREEIDNTAHPGLGEKLRKLLDRIADTGVAKKNIETKNILATLQKSHYGKGISPLFIVTHVDLLDKMSEFKACDIKSHVRQTLESLVDDFTDILFVRSLETTDNFDSENKPYLQQIGPSEETATVFWTAMHNGLTSRRHEGERMAMERIATSWVVPLLILTTFFFFFGVASWGTGGAILFGMPSCLAVVFGLAATVAAYPFTIKAILRSKSHA